VWRVLIVEDDPLMRAFFAASVQRSGQLDLVCCVGTVAEAKALLNDAEQLVDVLLTDLGLPDGSGLDLMRAIRAKGLKLAGIALSGYGQDNDIQQSREAGFAAHLVKPMSLPKLEEAIAKVVGDGIRIAGGGEEEDIG